MNNVNNQKISNLLNDVSDFRFVTRKWNAISDHSDQSYISDKLLKHLKISSIVQKY